MTLTRLPLIVTALALGAAAFGVTAGANAAAGSDLCSIETHARGGMVEIAGIVESDTPISGSYRFEVVSSGPGGKSNINQGGSFNAGPGGPVTLGRVTLGNPGATYDVRLAVSANGNDYVCEDSIAAR